MLGTTIRVAAGSPVDGTTGNRKFSSWCSSICETTDVPLQRFRIPTSYWIRDVYTAALPNRPTLPDCNYSVRFYT